jgi:hypothetical protein
MAARKSTRVDGTRAKSKRSRRRLAKRKTDGPVEDTAGQREPDPSAELMAILEVHVNALALIKTAIHGLQHEYTMTSEIVTLETAVKMLRRVDSSINLVAEGQPSEIRPEEIGEDDEESAE